MRGRPRLRPTTTDAEQMTNDEIQIALSFLKKRFNDYSLDEILLSLTQHLQERQTETFPTDPNNRPEQHNAYRANPRDEGNNEIQPRRTRITHNNRDQRELRENIFSISANNEEKLNKFQELRMVAKFFCETGINFSLVRYFFPDITPQKYRAYIDTINNQAINEIQKFLRYECNIQIEHLSTDQKRSLKSQLIKVRDWLGQKNVSQLETYYKFIQRHYEQKNVDISYDEALKLYKTLLQIIKSPFVDIMEVIDSQDREVQVRNPPNSRAAQFRSPQTQQLTRQEESRVVEGYLKLKKINRVTDYLNEKWGFSHKWSKTSIKANLKRCLRKSIKKVMASKEKYLSRSTPISFTDSEEDITTLYESQQSESIKEKLLKFYIANRITATGLNNIIKQLNTFFSRQEQSNQGELIESSGEVSAFPKLQPQPQKIQQEFPRRQSAKETARGRNIVKAEDRRRQGLVGADKSVNDDEQTEATEEEIKQQNALQNFSKCSYEEVIELD